MRVQHLSEVVFCTRFMPCRRLPLIVMLFNPVDFCLLGQLAKTDSPRTDVWNDSVDTAATLGESRRVICLHDIEHDRLTRSLESEWPRVGVIQSFYARTSTSYMLGVIFRPKHTPEIWVAGTVFQ